MRGNASRAAVLVPAVSRRSATNTERGLDGTAATRTSIW